MIRRIIAWLESHGVTDLVLNLHHRPETIAAVVGDGADLGVGVRYSWEQPTVLGSAGGPRQALPIIAAEVFLIVNGDTLTDVDVAELAGTHERSGALVTLALVPNRRFDRYGGVTLDDDGRVIGFVARGPSSEGSYHYIGVQVAHGEAFAALGPGEAANSIGRVYDDLIATRPGSVRGFVCAADFWDVGTVTDYWQTSRAFESRNPCQLGPAPARETRAIWGQTPDEKTRPGRVGWFAQRPARIDPSARVTGSILWDGVEIGAEAVIDECIVTDGVRIPPGAIYRRTVIVRGATDLATASSFDPGTDD